ncbi:unnamed protein product [Boreogadus saida]
MTVSHRRLAGLWPWLLMAALQVVFGQTGLGLAVASESERATPRAVIQVTLKHDQGTAITLEGVFVGGSAGYADGKLLQFPRLLTDFLSILPISLWEITAFPGLCLDHHG